MSELISDAQECKSGDESELEELADLARKLLAQREVAVESDDGTSSIVDLMTGLNVTPPNTRLPAMTMRGTSRQVIEAKRRLGMGLAPGSIIEACLFRMQDYPYGNRCGIWSIKLPGLKGEKVNDVGEAVVEKGEVVDSGAVGYHATKNINIKIVRRKKMNKHKWKKLRRKYRNSTRHSRSKRKRNREELMKEYSYLGMNGVGLICVGLEFGRK
jgi:hypothetical protein